MATHNRLKTALKSFKEEYDRLRVGKDSLLKLVDEAEIPEAVYNLNAIENSALTWCRINCKFDLW